jgi:hypothetical protein
LPFDRSKLVAVTEPLALSVVKLPVFGVVKPMGPGASGLNAVDATDASNLIAPAEFLKYNFSSSVLSANSPAAKLGAVGAADAVVL